MSKHDDKESLNLSIDCQYEVKEVDFELNLSQLKRTFCNLVTNALEACNFQGKVIINLKFQTDGLRLLISDNGIGILPIRADQLFERGFTTKASGNGLGLCAAKDYIESLGGSIHLEKLPQGTLVKIFIPSVIRESINNDLIADMVLIDDDPLVRFNWKRQGLLAKCTVHTFESFEDFLKSAPRYARQTPIYIDSNLGDQKGEDLSQTLNELGFRQIIITTGSPISNIVNKQWITSIVGKGFDLAIMKRS